MKLAEALLIRKELKKKVGVLKERIAKNAIVQEGDVPTEEPEALIRNAFSALREEAVLVGRINRTNMRCTLPDGMTMMEALARRDRLINEHAVLQGAIESAHGGYQVRQQLKWVKVFDVAALQKEVDDLDIRIREFNVTIQETNWLTELEE